MISLWYVLISVYLSMCMSGSGNIEYKGIYRISPFIYFNDCRIGKKSVLMELYDIMNLYMTTENLGMYIEHEGRRSWYIGKLGAYGGTFILL